MKIAQLGVVLPPNEIKEDDEKFSLIIQEMKHMSNEVLLVYLMSFMLWISTLCGTYSLGDLGDMIIIVFLGIINLKKEVTKFPRKP